MTRAQAEGLRRIAAAVVEAVDAAGPLGAPAGHLYAAMMGSVSLPQFQQIMSGMERAGMVALSGECYTATDQGRTFARLGVAS